MERRQFVRLTALTLGSAAIAPLFPSLALAQNVDHSQYSIPYRVSSNTIDLAPDNTQQLSDSLRKIYEATNAERLIDEVHLVGYDEMPFLTTLDCISFAQTTIDGRNQVFFNRNVNPKISSIARSALHELGNLMDPNYEGIKRFYPSGEERGRLGNKRELAIILPYNEHYLRKGRFLGRSDAWALTSSGDPLTRAVLTNRMVWTEIAERRFLEGQPGFTNDSVPSEFNDLGVLIDEVYERVSGQNMEIARERLRALFIQEAA